MNRAALGVMYTHSAYRIANHYLAKRIFPKPPGDSRLLYYRLACSQSDGPVRCW